MKRFSAGACCCSEPCDCVVEECMDLEVIIAGTGSVLDGTYTAVYNAGLGQFEFSAGGCTWIIGFAGSSLPTTISPSGTSRHNFDSPATCTQASGIAGVTYTYTYNSSGFATCSAGAADLGGGTLRVQWPCHYPEYVEILTDVSDGTCDCSSVLNAQLPILCGSSGIAQFNRLFYQATPGFGACFSSRVRFDWSCFDEVADLDFVDFGVNYQATGVKLTDLTSGSTISMSRTSTSTECTFPSSIDVRAQNNGFWC